MTLQGVRLGLGLTQLGRRWGVRASDVPSDNDASALLSAAVASGIRVFDTAPSYGSSERRFGEFLGARSTATRASLVVMTKCGEGWDDARSQPVVNHRYDALVESIDRSLQRLGTIDVLQVHRADVSVLRSRDLRRALSYARAAGIHTIGASVSDIASATVAIGELGVALLQFPYSRGNEYMHDAFRLAQSARCAVVVNRPLGMGRVVHEVERDMRPETDPETDPDTDPDTKPDTEQDMEHHADPLAVRAAQLASDRVSAAFSFVLGESFRGVVLCGTSCIEHLRMNIACFARARHDCGGSTGGATRSPGTPR